jgi:hypothetical protein
MFSYPFIPSIYFSYLLFTTSFPLYMSSMPSFTPALYFLSVFPLFPLSSLCSFHNLSLTLGYISHSVHLTSFFCYFYFVFSVFVCCILLFPSYLNSMFKYKSSFISLINSGIFDFSLFLHASYFHSFHLHIFPSSLLILVIPSLISSFWSCCHICFLYDVLHSQFSSALLIPNVTVLCYRITYKKCWTNGHRSTTRSGPKW